MNNEKKLNIKLIRIIFLCVFAFAICISFSGCDLFNSKTTTYYIYVYANNSNYGTVSGSGTYNAGQTVTITATPYSGYKFVNWRDGNTSASRTITVDSNKSYGANFESTETVTTYSIVVNSNNTQYGTVTGSGTYNAGQTITITATPNSGYNFVNWNDGNTSASRTITVDSDKTYTAIFESTGTSVTYLITAKANYTAYGTVTGGGRYNAGQTITITATPNSGYNFVNWNDGNTSASRTITVDSDKTYTANFESKYIEITVKSLDGNFEVTSTKTYTKARSSTGTYTINVDSTPAYWIEDSYYESVSTLPRKNFYVSSYTVSTAKDVVVYCVYSHVGQAAYISTSSDCDNVSLVDTVYNRSRSDNFIAYYYSGSSKYLHRGNSVDNTDTSKLLLSNYTNHTNYTAMYVFRAYSYYGFTEYAVVIVQNRELDDGDFVQLMLPSDNPESTDYVRIQ